MFLRLLMVTGLAAGAAGCTVHPLTFSGPYPVAGNPVNPTPTPAYRVVCSTGYGLGVLMFPSRTGYCRQELAPIEVQEAIQVRG
jgi:hypothetical protein